MFMKIEGNNCMFWAQAWDPALITKSSLGLGQIYTCVSPYLVTEYPSIRKHTSRASILPPFPSLESSRVGLES
jgi:hypothetical protein